MADTKTTVEMQSPPDWAISLTKKVVDGFVQVEARLDAMEANIDIQKSSVQDVMQRMTSLEMRQAASSEFVKQSSQVDLTHESAIAAIKVQVDALAARPDVGAQVLTAVERLTAKPLVAKLLQAAAGVVLLYLAAVATKLQTRAEAPAPAPKVVYLPAPVVDAGAP